ncbi:RING finger protein 207-like isoform X2 [Leptopilina heterotoma]|uniref:RING finger protein 207-like isoform X2 n=1 Tax=Leptopilina heterotoma TaxID=63436 RepID=UPI001CA80CF5|nr:RING finger protein 207-like isoform X2 [Leptopilina heterotoma]
MANSGSVATDGVIGENDAPSTGISSPRNPLICGICHDYYREPCLLSCFHTFCARCLRGQNMDSKISCPICAQVTMLKEGTQLPPADQLMRHLVELANSENPPCANCDKRDKSTMFFCTTCGQALCNHCREHTHRAKMFSTHEVVHMSKCAKDTQRRCPTHGEQYIMYSQSAKCMLCATCIRETPPDSRLHCVDIDLAWQQASKKIERAANSICEIQVGVKDGLLALKSQLDELRHSLESEKRSLNAYCQGMQDVINKSHNSVLADLQRQYESKERMVRAQLLSLGSALPVLQMHLMLCTAFTTGATRYQFLELAHHMLERLGKVAQLGHPNKPPMLSAHLKINYRSEIIRALQPYMSQTQPLKDSVYDLTHTIAHESQFIQNIKPSKLQQPTKPPSDSGPFSNHCRTFDSQLKELSQQLITVKERLGELHRDVALLRRANTPPVGSRYEHIARDCRFLEQQLDHHQTELERLRGIFDTLWEEQLCRIHFEKEIFHSQMNDILSLRSEVKQILTMAQQLEPFVKSFSSGMTAGEISAAASDAAGHQHLQVLLDHLARLQMQEPPQPQGPAPTKECRHPRESKEATPRCRTPSGGMGAILDSSGNIVVYGSAPAKPDGKRGVLSQLIDKARTKEDRKKSPGREEGRDRSQTRHSRKSPENQKPKTPPGHSKVRSFYRSLKGSTGDNSAEGLDQPERGDKGGDQQQNQQCDDCEYQRISEASTLGEAKKRVQAQVHPVPPDEKKSSRKSPKVYPVSDSEELFYSREDCNSRRRRRASCDSLSITGSETSIVEASVGRAAQDPRKTLVLLVGRRSTPSLVQKQRSWETFPGPKKRSGSEGSALGQLKKADSFEGHEEAVRTLVAAVQETRSQLRQHHLHHHRHHRKSKTN